MSQIVGADRGRSLTPCAVIVDTQNVRGQCRKVFGHGRQPTGAGIRAGLALYGFDAVEIYAGVATGTTSATPSRRVQDALDVNLKYKDHLEAAGVTVLEGNLAERKGALEEKQVDVLCALTVADIVERIKQGTSEARCIVMLSEDMDLMPAYEFAARRGITTYAAAHDTIHERPEQIEWMLLTQDALAKICEPLGRRPGSRLRSDLAEIATSPIPPILTNWKVVAPKMGDGRALMANNNGAYGLLTPSRPLKRGERVQLYAIGVEMEPLSMRFPYLQLSEQVAEVTFADIEIAEVLRWTAPTMVRVAIQNSTAMASLTASPGTLMPGQQVAVLTSKSAGQQGRHLIGATSAWIPPAGWSVPCSTAIAVVNAVATPSSGWMTASLEGSGDAVVIQAALLEHAKVGSRLMVALAGTHQGGLPQTMPLTCCLP